MYHSPRILFVGEAVTLAHTTRLLVLLESLSGEGYSLHFAAAPNFRLRKSLSNCAFWPLKTVAPQLFLSSLRSGKWIYSKKVLREYVAAELALFEEVQPDLIVGDLRLSLSISSRVADIPYINVTNAYWSPYAERCEWTVPAYRGVSLIGVRAANALFRYIRPHFLAWHARGLNAIAQEFDCESFGGFLEGFTAGDVTLYADVPELVRVGQLPNSHKFIGPVVWSPALPLPDWWNTLSSRLPVVYVTLGSSGDLNVLDSVFEVLGELGVQIVFATAGRVAPAKIPNGAFAAEYLPGAVVAKRADLVVSNGGSPTSYQALSRGCPVLGIASNLDQFLCMANIADFGAGRLIRADCFSSNELRSAARELLACPAYTLAAGRLSAAFARHDPQISIKAIVEQMLGEPNNVQSIDRDAVTHCSP